MALERLQLTDFRCLQSARLDFDTDFTLITGPNASGKTSLLEAIYVLGRGRSFRTRRLAHLIRRGRARFVVFGDVTGRGRHRLGVEGNEAGIRAKIDGVAAGSRAELALNLPVQIIDPEVHQLIEDGPVRRRRFLDWGVFHVEPGFVTCWQRYHQVLRQRNAALKAALPRTVTGAWDVDLVRYGDQLTLARTRYVERLSEHAVLIGRRLLNQELALVYRAGWTRGSSFQQALMQSWTLDQQRGATQVGPQRAELSVQLDGLAARDRVSRGQQKLLAAALLIAQIKLFPADGSVRPTLLLDDPAAELDDERLGALIREVSGPMAQLIVTSLHAQFASLGAPGRCYRLDRGSLESA